MVDLDVVRLLFTADTDDFVNSLAKASGEVSDFANEAKEDAEDISKFFKELDQPIEIETDAARAEMKGLRDEVRAVGDEVDKTKVDFSEFDTEIKTAGSNMGGLRDSVKGAAGPIGAVGGAASATAGALGGLSGAAGGAVSAVGNLAVAFAESGPLGLAIVGITIVIAGIISKFSAMREEQEKAAKAAEDLAKKIDAAYKSIAGSALSELEKSRQEVNDLRTEIDLLGESETRKITLRADLAVDQAESALEDFNKQVNKLQEDLDRTPLTALGRASKELADEETRLNLQRVTNLRDAAAEIVENRKTSAQLTNDLVIAQTELRLKGEADVRSSAKRTAAQNEAAARKRTADAKAEAEAQAALAEAQAKNAANIEGISERIREAFDLAGVVDQINKTADALGQDIEIGPKVTADGARKLLDGLQTQLQNERLDVALKGNIDEVASQLEIEVDFKVKPGELQGNLDALRALRDQPEIPIEFEAARAEFEDLRAQLGLTLEVDNTDLDAAIGEFRRLLKLPTKEQEEAQKAAREFAEGVNAAFEAARAFAQSAIGAADTLVSSLLGGSDAGKVLSDSFSQTATAAGQLIAGDYAGAIQSLVSSIFTIVSATDGFAAIQERLGQAAETLFEPINALFEPLARLGEPLAAYIESLADTAGLFSSLTPLIETFANVLTEVGPVLSSFGDSSREALGPVIETLTSLLGTVFAAFVPIIDILKPFNEIYNAQFVIFSKLLPVLEPFGRLILVVANLLSSVLVPILDVMVAEIDLVIAGIEPLVGILTSAIDFLVRIVSGVVTLADGFVGLFDNSAATLDVLGTALEFVSNVAGDIGTVFDDLASDVLTGFIDFVKGPLLDGFNTVVNVLSFALLPTIIAVGLVFEGFKLAAQGVTALFTGIGDLAGNIDASLNITENLNKALNVFGETIQGVGNFLAEGFSTIVEGVAGTFSDFGTFLFEGFTGLFQSIVDFLGLGEVADFLSDIGESLFGEGSVIGDIFSAANDVRQNISDSFQSGATTTVNFVADNFASGATGSTTDLSNGLISTGAAINDLGLAICGPAGGGGDKPLCEALAEDTEATEENTEATSKLSESLTNLPSFFNLNAARNDLTGSRRSNVTVNFTEPVSGEAISRLLEDSDQLQFGGVIGGGVAGLFSGRS